jgi:Rne/Rng family ribonuclease
VIRDLYNKDVQDVVVEGEAGFRDAKDFMRMLMPSHAKHVHHYKDSAPLFQRMHIEAQLDSMFSPTVTLKSGGYIVINQTEAWSRSTSIRAAPRASIRSRRRRARPIWKRPAKSAASCACATWPA